MLTYHRYSLTHLFRSRTLANLSSLNYPGVIDPASTTPLMEACHCLPYPFRFHTRGSSQPTISFGPITIGWYQAAHSPISIWSKCRTALDGYTQTCRIPQYLQGWALSPLPIDSVETPNAKTVQTSPYYWLSSSVTCAFLRTCLQLS